jgi:hypothetical protein
MPKINYQPKTFGDASLALIEKCNEIIEDYTAQGFVLTLRQLYYQLVSRDIIPNKQSEYKRIGSIVNDARLAGLIDWNAIEDRTRNLRRLSRWNTPNEIVESCARQFHMDMWEGQDVRPEVWIEKDALVGVIEGICNEYDVPFFSCRGYTSQSEMWGASQRLRKIKQHGQAPIIFHFGDHDPSGKDMTRDIIDRLNLFLGGPKLERLALNMDQVEQYNPPPNPAKTTDSRYAGYIKEFGDESWELDALEPSVIADLIRGALDDLIDRDPWDDRRAKIAENKRELSLISENWNRVVKFLKPKKKKSQ